MERISDDKYTRRIQHSTLVVDIEVAAYIAWEGIPSIPVVRPLVATKYALHSCEAPWDLSLWILHR